MAFTPRQAPNYQGAATQMSKDIGSSEMMTYAHYKRQRDEKREDARIQKKKDDRDYVMKSLMQGIEYGRKDDRNAVRDAQSDRQFKLQETELQQQQSTNIAKTQAEMNTSYRAELRQKQAEHADYVKGFNERNFGMSPGEGGSAMGFEQWVNEPENKMKQKYVSIEEARRFYNDPQGYTGATSNDDQAVDGEIDGTDIKEFFPEEPSISELEGQGYSEETSLTSQTQGGSIVAAAISPEEYAQQAEDAGFVGAETVETREAERIARRKQRAKDELARQTELRRQEIRRKDDEKYAKKHGLTFTKDTPTPEEQDIASEEAYRQEMAAKKEGRQWEETGRKSYEAERRLRRKQSADEERRRIAARNAPSDSSPEEEELKSQAKYEGDLGKKITQQKKKAFEEKKAKAEDARKQLEARRYKGGISSKRGKQRTKVRKAEVAQRDYDRKIAENAERKRIAEHNEKQEEKATRKSLKEEDMRLKGNAQLLRNFNEKHPELVKPPKDPNKLPAWEKKRLKALKEFNAIAFADKGAFGNQQ